MGSRKEFWQVDAFTTERYCGNPAAVVFDATGISGAQMQIIAGEMNLSETVFVLPAEDPSADYKVRIFTPRNELQFAGHPTLATAHAMVARGLKPKQDRLIRQECGIGVIPVEIADAPGGHSFTMTQGAPAHRVVQVDTALAARMLGCDRGQIVAEHPVEVVSTGVEWMIVPLRDLATMAALTPDLRLIEQVCRDHKASGVTTFCPGATTPGCSYRLRTFAPGDGIIEDPVCGSGNGSVAAYIARHFKPGEATFSYRAEQGIEIRRPGTIEAEVRRAAGSTAVRIGGRAVTVIEGWLAV